MTRFTVRRPEDLVQVRALLVADVQVSRISAMRRVLVAVIAFGGAVLPVAIVLGYASVAESIRVIAAVWVGLATVCALLYLHERSWRRRREELAKALAGWGDHEAPPDA